MPKKRKKKISKVTQEYNKEYANLKARVRRQVKQGYIGFQMPSRVKNPTQASIRRLKSITAREIREKSSLSISLKTGEIITKEQARREEAQRRSESGRKAAKARRLNVESARRSFAEAFNIDYLPTAQNIQTNNFMEDVISKVTPVDFFRELVDMLKNANFNEDFYKLKYSKQRKHRQNQDIIIKKILDIIRNKQANKVYYQIVNSGNKDNLLNAIEKSVYGYEDSEITEGKTQALQILNGGVLSIRDYNDLADESDEEE